MSGNPPPSATTGAPGGSGLLRRDPEGATVAFERFLPHPVEEVWEAITDPEQIRIWFSARVTRSPTGGRLDLQHIGGVHATGRVLEWDPPRVYEYEWNADAGPSMPEAERSIVRWELTPSPEGTLLRLTHRKLTDRTARVFARGLVVFLDRLSAHLDHRPLPEPSWLAQAPPPDRPDRER